MTIREELNWRKVLAAYTQSCICDDLSVNDILDTCFLEGADRDDAYAYIIDSMRDIVANFKRKDSKEQQKYLDGLGICTGDIHRFEDEISMYDNLTKETCELSLSQVEVRHALELVLIVENLIELAGCDTEEACRACNTPMFVYDFAKQLGQIPTGYDMDIADAELDALNEEAYRTACEIYAEYEVDQLEETTCMNKEKNEKLQKQKKIVYLCYGAGHTPDELLDIGIFDADVIEKEWEKFICEEHWKYITECYSYNGILEEIRKHIGVRVALAMGQDIKDAARYCGMSGAEHCWASIIAQCAGNAGLVIPVSYIMDGLDGLLTDIRVLVKKRPQD